MASLSESPWMKDDSYSIEDQQKRGQPYIIDENGKKKVVSFKKMIRDVRLGRESAHVTQNIIVPKPINSILKTGDIIIGQSIDSNYLGFIRQHQDTDLFHVQFGLRRLFPQPQIMTLPILSLFSPVDKVAFSMNQKNKLAVFYSKYRSSMNVVIHSLMHELTIENVNENVPTNDSYKSAVIVTLENQVYFDLPISWLIWRPKFYFFRNYSEIPEKIKDHVNYTVVQIYSLFYFGPKSLAFVSLRKKNGYLHYTRNALPNSEISVVLFEPDISSIVYYHLIRKHPSMIKALFIDYFGDIQHFDEHSSSFLVYLILDLDGQPIYIQCFLKMPTFSISHAERQVEFLMIKKLAPGSWKVRTVHEFMPELRVKTDLNKFSASFAFADLTANESVHSIKPHFGGFEYTC